MSLHWWHKAAGSSSRHSWRRIYIDGVIHYKVHGRKRRSDYFCAKKVVLKNWDNSKANTRQKKKYILLREEQIWTLIFEVDSIGSLCFFPLRKVTTIEMTLLESYTDFVHTNCFCFKLILHSLLLSLSLSQSSKINFARQ